MKCRDVMTKYVKMCRAECTIKDSTQIMKDMNCGIVPIVNEKNELLGLVTDRDIALHTILEDRDPETTKTSEIMTSHPVTCGPDDNIDLAIQKMKENKIRRIPVVDNNNKLLGIISLGDIAVLSKEEHETFEALESISNPVSYSK